MAQQPEVARKLGIRMDCTTGLPEGYIPPLDLDPICYLPPKTGSTIRFHFCGVCYGAKCDECSNGRFPKTIVRAGWNEIGGFTKGFPLTGGWTYSEPFERSDEQIDYHSREEDTISTDSIIDLTGNDCFYGSTLGGLWKYVCSTCHGDRCDDCKDGLPNMVTRMTLMPGTDINDGHWECGTPVWRTNQKINVN